MKKHSPVDMGCVKKSLRMQFFTGFLLPARKGERQRLMRAASNAIPAADSFYVIGRPIGGDIQLAGFPTGAAAGTGIRIQADPAESDRVK